MGGEKVRVWVDDRRDVQHLASPPDDPISHAWEGTCLCGADGALRWITPEHVDGGKACAACMAATGFSVKLEGGHPGPP